MKALNVSPRTGHQMGYGEKQAFLHAQTIKDHGKISLKCIPRGGPDGKRASFGQDIREMYSPTLFFTAFRRLKHT